MANGMNISGTSQSASPETVDEVKEAIVWILNAAFENHMSEAVTIKALDVLGAASEAMPGVTNTSITDCTIETVESMTANGPVGDR